MSGKVVKLTEVMPSSREKAVKLAVLPDEQLLAGYSMWEQGPAPHPGRTAQRKDCVGMLRALLALLKEPGSGSQPGVNPNEPLSGFSAAVSQCRGVQCMGGKSGDTAIVSAKIGWLCSVSASWEACLNLLRNSCIPRAQEQWDWFHCERCRAGSWSILHPVHMKKALGTEGQLAFPLPWRMMR